MARALTQRYGAAFFDGQSSGSRRSAEVVVPLVNGLVRPGSVLDVGCGVGTWLAEWVSEGVTDVIGLDGGYVDRAAMQIQPAKFRPADLRNPFSLGRRFGLVESLEVAEHLDETCADAFVRSLVSHSDTVLFSAAIPGQGGTHHVNEQWPSYWVTKFTRAGLRLFDVIRPAIWNDRRVDWWYRQNILLFSKSPAFDMYDTCIDIAHPEFWEARQKSYPLVRQIAGKLPPGLTRALRSRVAQDSRVAQGSRTAR
jgi:SAM-dependent methyltransferase